MQVYTYLLAAMLASACFCVQNQKVFWWSKVCDAPPWLPLDSRCSLKEEEFLKMTIPNFQSLGFSKDTRSLTEALGS